MPRHSTLHRDRFNIVKAGPPSNPWWYIAGKGHSWGSFVSHKAALEFLDSCDEARAKWKEYLRQNEQAIREMLRTDAKMTIEERLAKWEESTRDIREELDRMMTQETAAVACKHEPDWSTPYSASGDGEVVEVACRLCGGASGFTAVKLPE